MAYQKIEAEVQRITAGGNFNGTVPPGSSAITNGVRMWDAGATGGLMTLDHTSVDTTQTQKRVIERVSLKLAGQSDWSISVVNSDTTTSVVWLSGTTQTDVMSTDRLELLPSESLVFATTGAAGALEATVVYEVEEVV